MFFYLFEQSMHSGPLIKRFAVYLSAPIIQGIISLFMIPVKTYVLGPEEFGVYALLTSLVSLPVAIAPLGSAFLLAQYFPAADHLMRVRLVTSICITSLVNLFLLMLLLFGIWSVGRPTISSLQHITTVEVLVTFAGLPFLMLWNLVLDINVLEGRADFFAKGTIFQSIVSSIILVVSLYWLDLGALSLYLSSTAGAIAAGVFAAKALRPYLHFDFAQDIVVRIYRSGVSATFSSILEQLQRVFENHIVASFAGTYQLGLYSHSQQYRNLAMMPIKAMARTIWPTSLSESEGQSGMEKTQNFWIVSNLLIAHAALACTVFGEWIISKLTHGQFSSAYIYVSIWISFLIVQNLGRTQLATLWSRGEGGYCANALTLSNTGCIVLMFCLVPTIGMPGAFLALFLSQVIFVIALQRRSKTYGSKLTNDVKYPIGFLIVLLHLWLCVANDFNILMRFTTAILSSFLILIFLPLLSPQLWKAIQKTFVNHYAK